MEQKRIRLAWTLFGLGVLTLTLAAMANRSGRVRLSSYEDLRDAVASPAASPMLGGASVSQPGSLRYFASPAARREEAESALMSSRNRRRETARFPAVQ